MLVGETTKSGTGIALLGDYLDIALFERTADKIADQLIAQSVMPQHLVEFAAGISWGSPHGYELISKPTAVEFHNVLPVKYVGFRVAWPLALAQAAILRQIAGYALLDKGDLSTLLRLEYLIEQTLQEYDLKVAPAIIDWFRTFGVTPRYLPAFVNALTFEFVFHSGTGRRRFARLPALLNRLREGAPEYQAFAADMERRAAAKHEDPAAYDDFSDWPKIKW